MPVISESCRALFFSVDGIQEVCDSQFIDTIRRAQPNHWRPRQSSLKTSTRIGHTWNRSEHDLFVRKRCFGPQSRARKLARAQVCARPRIRHTVGHAWRARSVKYGRCSPLYNSAWVRRWLLQVAMRAAAVGFKWPARAAAAVAFYPITNDYTNFAVCGLCTLGNAWWLYML